MTPRVGLGVDDGDAGAALGCIWPQAQASKSISISISVTGVESIGGREMPEIA